MDHKGGYEGRESNPLNVIAFLGNKETRDSEGGGTEAAERQVCSGCHFQARPLESVLYSFLSPLQDIIIILSNWGQLNLGLQNIALTCKRLVLISITTTKYLEKVNQRGEIFFFGSLVHSPLVLWPLAFVH